MERIFKIFGKFLIVLVMLLSMLLLAFTEYSSDDKYCYQWALKNNGNFLADRGLIADNYKIAYFSKDWANASFFDDANIVSYLKETQNDPGRAYAKKDFDINFEKGYEFFNSLNPSRECIVAVIDSGVDINHYEIADNIWVNEVEIPDNNIDDDNNGYVDDVNGYNFIDNNGKVFVSDTIDIHGTHAAGTIVAKHGNGGIKGLAYNPNIKIMPLKILGENGKGSMSALIDAIYYAKKNGAKICNISLGAYSYDKALDDAIKSCPDMLFVVAAGNGANFIGYSLDERDVYPAKLNYDNVIAVGDACFDGERYVSSNYGSYVSVFAPGTLILSTIPNGDFGYLTGTSMAAPFVTATCAMLYSAYPKLDINKYKKIIIESATKYESLKGLSASNGLLNVYDTLVNAGK